MVKNDDEVKDLDAEIGDLQLKESTSTEASSETAIVEGYPILNEAISASEQTMPSMLPQPSVVSDPQTPVEQPATPTVMDGIFRRQISERPQPVSPERFLPSSPTRSMSF